MPGVRDHAPFVIENFGGLWDRGDFESAPSDHFIQADNIQFFNSGFQTRDPISPFQTTSIGVIVRTYNYVMPTGQSLLVLTNLGQIFHIIPSTPQVIHGPILSIPLMEDFGFVAIAGRAYITPFKTYTNTQGVNYELGLQNEFLYVYKGDGTPARKAGGNPPDHQPIGEMGAAGLTDEGFHLISVIYETDTGYLTSPSAPAGVMFSGVNKIDLSFIPISPDPFVIKRHIVSSKFVPEPFNGDLYGYQFFFVPNGNIDNNTATTKTVEFFDSDLLSDASHLIDNFAQIPAGVNLNTYHSRLVIVGEYGSPGTMVTRRGRSGAVVLANETDNRSVARLSMPGEPEAISKIDGLIIAPLDGNPLTNAQEFRDVLYLFKKTRTYAYSDNMDEPVTWQEEIVDQGIGVGVHGIASVLDAGGVNIDFLLIADWSGLMLFNGTYARPELSWKIEDTWYALDRNNFRYIEVANDSLNKKIWITLPGDRKIVLHADYRDGLDAKNIKWSKLIYTVEMLSLCLFETDKLILAGKDVITPPAMSGIYFVDSKKVNSYDTHYTNSNNKIPNPTIRTAYFGE